MHYYYNPTILTIPDLPLQIDVAIAREVDIILIASASDSVLEYSCNKYCNLIGQSEVSISHRDLQVFIKTYKFQ